MAAQQALILVVGYVGDSVNLKEGNKSRIEPHYWFAGQIFELLFHYCFRNIVKFANNISILSIILVSLFDIRHTYIQMLAPHKMCGVVRERGVHKRLRLKKLHNSRANMATIQ